MKLVVQDIRSLSGPSYLVVTIGPIRSFPVTTLFRLLLEGNNESTKILISRRFTGELVEFCIAIVCHNLSKDNLRTLLSSPPFSLDPVYFCISSRKGKNAVCQEVYSFCFWKYYDSMGSVRIRVSIQSLRFTYQRCRLPTLPCHTCIPFLIPRWRTHHFAHIRSSTSGCGIEDSHKGTPIRSLVQ